MPAPLFLNLHLILESFTDLTAINNELWSLHTRFDPFPPPAISSATQINTLKEGKTYMVQMNIDAL